MAGRAHTGEAAAVRLLFAVLVTWLVVQVSFNFWQAAANGYGSGFGDGNHRPTQERLDNIEDTFLLRGDGR